MPNGRRYEDQNHCAADCEWIDDKHRFYEMHPQHEIDLRLPPARGDDDGPGKQPPSNEPSASPVLFGLR